VKNFARGSRLRLSNLYLERAGIVQNAYSFYQKNSTEQGNSFIN